MTAPVIEMSGVTAGYESLTALREVSVTVHAGEVLAVLGANGAGKSTLLRAAAGVIRPWAGRVVLDGTDVTRAPAHQRVARGLCLIPEGRGIFRNLTVAQNLRLQAGSAERAEAGLDRVAHLFPVLRDRIRQTAGTLSGGQQQMLAMARAYLTRPRVVLIDEVSMGLAPVVLDDIFAALRTLVADGTALIIVEQYVSRALDLADTAMLLVKGRTAYRGPATDLDEAAIARDYLGYAS
ncbi:ABC transporter ATP-binding protein [Amycolatopsis pigmentata]|uniref:ABC transporter ATP-binding protein n=1 Tax=Amycolatopsis pigmentata TaxID=450801 RepID=A0ABW5G4I3_9PSEU